MVAAMAERTERANVVDVATVVLDYFCPICRSGYLGWVRFAAGSIPMRGTMNKSGHCSRCRKWREVDLADGVLRSRPTLLESA